MFAARIAWRGWRPCGVDDLVAFVDNPVVFRLEKGVVRAEIESGGKIIRIAMSVNVFLATFRNAAETAHQWRGGRGEVVDFPAAEHG